jgi:hypothetical protein
MATNVERRKVALRGVRNIFDIFCKHLGIRHPVHLRFIRRLPDYGQCDMDDEDNIVIVINSSAQYTVMVDSLVHEYAHALRMAAGDQVYGHSDDWGKAYARVYRVYAEHVLGETEE